MGARLCQAPLQRPEDDSERLRIYEKALNTDESNEEDVKEFLKLIERPKEQEEIRAEQEIEEQKKEIKKQETMLAWMDRIRSRNQRHEQDFASKGCL